jgi:hypothetical protein
MSPYNDTILLYTFNEKEGDETEDLSGFGTAVDISNAPVSSEWRWQSPCGLRSKTSGTSWRTGNATMNKVTNAIKSSGEYSIEVWVRTHHTSQTGPARIFSISKGGGGSCAVSDNIISLMQEGDDFRWRLPTGSCNEKNAANELDSNHLDIQFVVTFGGDAVELERSLTYPYKIYHNGDLVLSGTTTSSIPSWGTGYELALFNTPWLVSGDRRPWLGVIYKVAMWDRVLPQSEVISAFKKGKCYPKECSCECKPEIIV